MTKELDETNKKKSEKTYSIIIVILIFIGLGYFYMQSRKTKMTNTNTSQPSTMQTDENFLPGRTDLAPLVRKQNRTRYSSTRQNPTRMSTSLKSVPLTPGNYISRSPFWPDWSGKQN